MGSLRHQIAEAFLAFKEEGEERHPAAALGLIRNGNTAENPCDAKESRFTIPLAVVFAPRGQEKG